MDAPFIFASARFSIDVLGDSYNFQEISIPITWSGQNDIGDFYKMMNPDSLIFRYPA